MGKRKHSVDTDSEEEFKASKFVDVEASEDDPSDNESMDDFINEIAEDVEVVEDEPEEEKNTEEFATSSEDKLEDFEEYTKKVEERYKNVDSLEVEEIPQQLLLPTEKSPKLWLIRCTPTKERSIVLAILRKATLSKLNIVSVLSNELVKGYIYIEAYQKQQVTQAIEGVFGAFKTNITQVPNKEMVDVLYLPELDPVIYKEGNYLRVIKGAYSGEIVKIDTIGASKGKIQVKILPKVNEKYKLFDAKDYSPSEVYKMSKSTWVHKKEMYKDGYLLKELPITHMASTPMISKEEKKWFETAENRKTTGCLFVKDEVVEVVFGGLKGAVGKIVVVGEEEAIILIGDKKVSVSLQEIKKRYSVGDEVQVVSGRNRGECGFVVGISKNKLMVGINSFTDEIEVEIDEVKLCSVPDTRPEEASSPKRIAKPKRDPLVDKQGEITSGEYKGKRGVIKDVLSNMYRVQLITTLKCINVKKRDFEIQKRSGKASPLEKKQEKEETDEDESTVSVRGDGDTPVIEPEEYKPTEKIYSLDPFDEE
ncbi:transcription elongation factor SPT5 [Nematocida major]|uniref:transcription elongation factor SPT5 n=1 Tax=Nematocida major TaxID=1912982 RepID=UPI0020074E89|nr:transcription elongation factor SPT5 [Nematocida major]KAH9386252.1 transcription elongation factor SPT5 [Nematocida major]